jgi:DNA-binding transcriptional regulator/RsmH inhibitor MraZ
MIPTNSPASVEFPRSTANVRIDDKGRIKLSAEYQHYFEALPEQDVFVTSLDRSIAEIFPIARWRLMEDFFEENESNPDIYLASKNAMRLGAVAKVDNQGRVNIHAELRRALNLDGQELHIEPYRRSRVQIVPKAVYDATESLAAKADPKALNESMRKAGLPK